MKFFLKNGPNWFYLFFIILFISSDIKISYAASDDPDKETLTRFLSKTVELYHIPGLAVSIVDKSGIHFSASFGFYGKNNPITESTTFLLGSTSKTFTALAIMRLVEQGILNLDSPVIEYLPEFKLASPEFERKITIRHLLNHTSGLSEKGMPSSSLGEDSLEGELIKLRQCKPVAAPGERYEYFNQNYRLLGLVIEKISGTSFEAYLKKEIFSPLGMVDTYAGPAGKNRAAGYGEIFGLPYRRNQKFRAGAIPSGYISSSAADISKYLIEELRAGNNESTVFNHETIKLTWTPPGDKKEGYAMGWYAFDITDMKPFIGHGGALENYQSFFYLCPAQNLGFVFLMNQGGIMPMMGGFNTLRNGLIAIMNNREPEYGPGILPVFIISFIFILITGFEIYFLWRIRPRKTRTLVYKKWKTWVWPGLDLVISISLFVFLYDGYAFIYSMLPELFFLLILMIISGLLRVAIRTSRIIKNFFMISTHRL